MEDFKIIKQEGCPEIRLYEYGSLESTNRTLLEMAKNGAPCGTVVRALSQSGGRGRLGRSFSSPEGGIYLSVLLPFEKEGLFLTAMAGVAVKRTISEVCGINCGIKWVNDIVYKGKKVCGILAQGFGDKVVVGIGINYKTDKEKFPADVREIACSLYDKFSDAPSMETFVLALIRNIYKICYGMDNGNWLAEYKSSDIIIGNKVKIMQAGKITGEGTAVFIDDSCFLHVIGNDNKEIVLSTGEVSVRIKND